MTTHPRKKGRYLTDGLLSVDQQRQVIQWLVDRQSPTEVASLVKEEFGIEITRQAIWAYRHSDKWKPIIDRLQRAIEKNLSKIPIANKAYRIQALQTTLKEALTWCLKSETKMGKPIYELNLGAAVRALEAAKEEVDPSRNNKNDKETHLHLHLTVEERNVRTGRLQEFYQN